MTPEPARFVSKSEAEQPPPKVLEQPADATAPMVPIPVDMRNAAVTMLAVIATVFLLQYAQTVFIPLVLGLLMSYALDPAVTKLQKLRIPRAVGAGILILALVGGGGFMLYQLRAQAQQIIQQLPDGARRLRQTVAREQRGTTDALQKVQQAATELQKATDSADADAVTTRRHARAGGRRTVQRRRLRDVGLARHCRGGRPTAAHSLPRLLSAGDRRSLPSKARENRRAVTHEEENHCPDPAGDRSANRVVPHGAGIHKHDGRRGYVAGVPVARARTGRRVGLARRESSTPSRTSARSSCPVGPRSSRSCSSAPLR